jgi:hypothetical protein
MASSDPTTIIGITRPATDWLTAASFALSVAGVSKERARKGAVVLDRRAIFRHMQEPVAVTIIPAPARHHQAQFTVLVVRSSKGSEERMDRREETDYAYVRRASHRDQGPREKVFEFLQEPNNLPRWAHACVSAGDGSARLKTPTGAVDIVLDVSADAETGIVDWRLAFPDGGVGIAQSRVTETTRGTCIYSSCCTRRQWRSNRSKARSKRSAQRCDPSLPR